MRKQLDELKGIIKNEEQAAVAADGGGLNPVIQQGLDKLK
jgi:hypothetical protein